ncbi:protein neuralized [Elysia marginata]|uniref:Protein neuralized n=1 Tax=Elysia marginata TaxID=1093978 RepID=A0AAV4EL02_9GAST|nr:protein neuralized [Elysia marginata]
MIRVAHVTVYCYPYSTSLTDYMYILLSGGVESLAEEQDQAVATNLALEVLLKLRLEPGSTTDFRDTQVKEAGPSRLDSPAPNKDIIVVSSDQSSPSFTTPVATDIPAHIAKTVAEILQRKQEEDRQKSSLRPSSSSPVGTCGPGGVKTSDDPTRPEGDSTVDTHVGVQSCVQGVGVTGEAQDETVVLSIWDFAGQAAYYTTHQVSISLLSAQFNLQVT